MYVKQTVLRPLLAHLCFHDAATPSMPGRCLRLLLMLRRYFTSVLKAAAAQNCGGKLLFFHEGGYSAYYVPFCGLAVVEELAGVTTKVVDPELEEHCKVRHVGCSCAVAVQVE